MKTPLLATTLALGLGLLTGCGFSVGSSTTGPNVSIHGSGPAVEGSGTLASETRTVGEFHAIQVGHAFTTLIEVGAEPGFELTGDDNLLSLVTVEVEDGRLVVAVDRSYSTEHGLSLRIGTPSLDDLEVGGAAKVTVQDVDADAFRLAAGGASKTTITGTIGGLELDASGSAQTNVDGLSGGSADIDLSGASRAKLRGQLAGLTLRTSGASKCDIERVDGGDARVELAGASRATITGDAGRLTLEATGSAAADLSRLSVQELTIDLSGASKVQADVSDRIRGGASGASRLTYTGSPTTVDVDTSPAASVTPE